MNLLFRFPSIRILCKGSTFQKKYVQGVLRKWTKEYKKIDILVYISISKVERNFEDFKSIPIFFKLFVIPLYP